MSYNAKQGYAQPQQNPVFQCAPEHKKLIQVPVVEGYGEKQELVVKELTIAPPSPAVFRIVDIDKEVVITDTKLVPIPKCDDDFRKDDHFRGKVIINGFIDKNIIYKTITDYTATDVNGPVFQFTTRIAFDTFVEVKATEPLCETDCVEILKAFVEGEKDELLSPNPIPAGAPCWAVTYNRILEKMIVCIKLKVTRTEHLPIKVEK